MANALYIDYEFCSGCHSCEIACRNELEIGINDFGMKVLEDKPRQDPDGKWHWDYIAYPTELCDLCAERLTRGREPVCVHNCLGACMKFGTIEEMAAELAKKPKQVLWAPCE